MFSGIFLAHLILILHGLLLLGLTFLVLFFRGILSYMPWIFALGTLFILASGAYLFWRIRKSQRNLRDILSDPSLQGRALEISFLGGLASLRLGNSTGSDSSLLMDHRPHLMLENSPEQNLSRLETLAVMYRDGLLSREEFEQMKTELLDKDKS